MSSLVVIAEVENPKKWESSFGSRSKFFREHADPMGLHSPVQYGLGDSNKVVVIEEIDDPGAAIKMLRSRDNVAAMKADGVNVDTLQAFIAGEKVNF